MSAKNKRKSYESLWTAGEVATPLSERPQRPSIAALTSLAAELRAEFANTKPHKIVELEAIDQPACLQLQSDHVRL